VLLLIGAVPAWPYGRGWGHYPSGLPGVILLIVIILLLTGTYESRRRLTNTRP
jgi:Protein of unknown function (DUF3309)